MVSEAVYVDTEYLGKPTGKKLTVTVETDVINPNTAIWQMNKATNNYLKKIWGNDSTTWIGKEVEVNVRKVGNMSASVYPVDCSLEKTLS